METFDEGIECYFLQSDQSNGDFRWSDLNAIFDEV
jgi:hypothetical protein